VIPVSKVHFDEVALYDGRKALYQNLSFTLGPGEIAAVYGPSRTGKSSVLLLASGHLRPSKGRVLVDGEKPKRDKAGLGPIHDLTPLFDTLTVQESLLFQARLYGVRNLKQRVEQLIADYELSDVRSYRIKDLANLVQFRIGLAHALVHRPELVLLDEPERGLTNGEWELAYRDIARLAQEGKTVMLTTVLEQVADRCSTVVQLPNGEVRTR
jgi:ABC-type multidrug transport system ATPase subunit